MSNFVEVVVTGDINLKAALDDFAQRRARQMVREALTTTAKKMTEDIREAAPNEVSNTHPEWDGDLKESIDYKITNAKQGVIRAVVGPTYNKVKWHGKTRTGSPGIYSLWVEFGTKTKQFTKNPFMRPTFDARSEQWMETFRNTLAAEISNIKR
jgi:HK97 gp10 family phage protein